MSLRYLSQNLSAENRRLRSDSWLSADIRWYQGWSMYDIPYASRYDVQVNIPIDDLPKDGVESNVVYQMLHDELTLDGNPNLNLASFVHTWVPDGE